MTDSDSSIGVLFVCMGNICRSPAGEGVFRYYVEKADLGNRIRIDSAGTLSYHAGEPADYRMRNAAANRGYNLTSIARQVTQQDLEEFDLIIAMDQDNFRELQYLAGDRKIELRLLGSFMPGAPGGDSAPPVPDPYYGGENGFEKVLDMIETACPSLLSCCREILNRK